MCLQNEDGHWALFVAASHGHLEMVQDLERVKYTACTGCIVVNIQLLYLRNCICSKHTIDHENDEQYCSYNKTMGKQDVSTRGSLSTAYSDKD